MNHEAFVNALRADPADEATRLVYADWLEDHGQGERAEFIRLEMRLLALPDDHPRRPVMKERRGELLSRYGAAWLGPKPAALIEPEWHGGVVAGLRFAANASPGDIAPLVYRHPVHRLAIEGRRTFVELAEDPVLGLVRDLVLSGFYSSKEGVKDLGYMGNTFVTEWKGCPQ